MFDPAVVRDVLPITPFPVLDATIKLLGAVSVIMTLLATILPKVWSFTQWIAQHAPDFRGIVPAAAAKNEALAQAIGKTTVSPALAAEPDPPAPAVLYPLPKDPL